MIQLWKQKTWLPLFLCSPTSNKWNTWVLQRCIIPLCRELSSHLNENWKYWCAVKSYRDILDSDFNLISWFVISKAFRFGSGINFAFKKVCLWFWCYHFPLNINTWTYLTRLSLISFVHLGDNQFLVHRVALNIGNLVYILLGVTVISLSRAGKAWALRLTLEHCSYGTGWFQAE